MDPLVSTDWLEQELSSPDLRIIDATFFLPSEGRSARAEFETAHIPGAVFMDLDEIVDSHSPFPHMLPSPEKFASRMISLGLRDGSHFVVYDNSPLHSAARAWWMLKLFGAHNVAILDGGFQKWQREERPVEAGHTHARHAHFAPSFDDEAVAGKLFVLENLSSHAHEIVDARSASRFSGEAGEPRPGLPSGHIPGSKNLPQSSLFNGDNSWKRGAELKAAFDGAGVDLEKPMITTCGSGITAAVLLFGAYLLGKTDVKLYDGSWSEWASDPATPKAKGNG